MLQRVVSITSLDQNALANLESNAEPTVIAIYILLISYQDSLIIYLAY